MAPILVPQRAYLTMAEPIVIWEPQPGPQTALLSCPFFEVFFGGARGGGKTDGMLGDWLGHADRYGRHANGLMVRRELTQLRETIERSKEIYTHLGARYVDDEKQWRFRNGARLKFAYLERDSDAEVFQGGSFSRLYVEEIGNFPDPKPIFKLMATLRSGAGVPVGFRCTGNPGGPGHGWVKARYIDPHPLGMKPITDDNGLQRVFIPSKVSDNKILLSRDPGYVNRIKASGSPELVKAWLDGDWNVVAGAFFPEFGIHHVVAARSLPAEWTRFRSMDWGSARPFSVGWWAVSDGSMEEFPRGSIIRYREWYGASSPNVGLRMPAEDVGKGIVDREKGDRLTFGVLDPAAWISDGGPSIAERLFRAGASFRRADNSRVAKMGAMGGWDQVRSRLLGEEGKPMIYFFATCPAIIRTLPALQSDPDRPEDVDSSGEDHACDETRYACMARSYVRQVEKKPPPEFWPSLTLDQLWKQKPRSNVIRI